MRMAWGHGEFLMSRNTSGTDGESFDLEQRVSEFQGNLKKRSDTARAYLSTLREECEKNRTTVPYDALRQTLGQEMYGTVELTPTGFTYTPTTPEGDLMGKTLLNVARIYAPLFEEDPLNPMEFPDKSQKTAYHYSSNPNSKVYEKLVGVMATMIAQSKSYRKNEITETR